MPRTEEFEEFKVLLFPLAAFGCGNTKSKLWSVVRLIIPLEPLRSQKRA